MVYEYLNRVNNTIQIAVLLFVIIRSIALVRKSGRSVIAAYFTFGCISFLMSDLYWVAFSFINAGERMPFAANEFGESASFLLFSSVLAFAFQGKIAAAGREIILAAVFGAANIALWIGWSGEWVQDIGGGIVFTYFLCTAVRALKQTEALSLKEWAGLCAVGYLVVIMQALLFFVPESFKRPLDVICYVLLYAGILFFCYKICRTFRQGDNPDAALSLTFAGYGWIVVSLYMCAVPIYELTNLLITVVFLIMLDAVRKKVEES